MLITKKQSIFKYISCAPYPLISDFILYLPLETVMKQYYHPFFSKQFFLFKSTSKDNLKLFFGFYHHTINQSVALLFHHLKLYRYNPPLYSKKQIRFLKIQVTPTTYKNTLLSYLRCYNGSTKTRGDLLCQNKLQKKNSKQSLKNLLRAVWKSRL